MTPPLLRIKIPTLSTESQDWSPEHLKGGKD
nr:MAG TPA: hypothetical protein [Caudoviricetes sp.]